MMRATTSSMLKERLYDYSLVTSEKLKQWLRDNEIEVISFRDGKENKNHYPMVLIFYHLFIETKL